MVLDPSKCKFGIKLGPIRALAVCRSSIDEARRDDGLARNWRREHKGFGPWIAAQARKLVPDFRMRIWIQCVLLQLVQ
jgi:hypothetical protein